jgi:hypothetical protein
VNFYTSQMRLTSAATVGTLLGLVLMFGACGGEESATAERVTTSTAKAKPSPAKGSCGAQLRGFVRSLVDLRERLVAGLDYRGYLSEVRGVRIAYEGVEIGGLGLDCLIAGATAAERAFNLYIDAANAWGDCLTDAACETASVEPGLQRKWALASDLVSRAQRDLG